MDGLPLKPPRLWKSKADFFRPFRTAAAASAATSDDSITPLYDPAHHRAEPEEPDLKELNAALAALVDVFPDVEPEVFREMLAAVAPESRLQVVTEHLLARRAKWVRGRYRVPGDGSGKSDAVATTTAAAAPKRKRPRGNRAGGLADEQTFRSEAYKKAVRQVCYQEFRSLSHSSIRGILAEHNFSYVLARPILQGLAARSWRISFSALWSRRGAGATVEEHPFILRQEAGDEGGLAVKRTGSASLDRELFELFVEPVVAKQKRDLLANDYAVASEINEKQAEEAEALFDCECCYGSVPFEELSTCDDACHQLCFDCLRRTVNEALFGQGWARTADLARSTVRCFSPTGEGCHGVIPTDIVRRALSKGAEDEDTWNEFQQRVATEVLSKSQLPIKRCPLCPYAEVDETPSPRLRDPLTILHHIVTHTATILRTTSPPIQILILAQIPALFLFAPPLLLAFTLLALFAPLAHLPTHPLLHASWTRTHRRRRPLKFHCRRPPCSITTCIRCTAPWRDPHTCFETESTNLRTAIETSATAAIKRTCPKCLLSFVKASGCNKLVCNCGYTMCYVCRAEVGSKEGYAHFCQHFRPNGGRCGECERCDLYGDEDEEGVIRRAVEGAERAWREKEGDAEGGRDELATRAMVEALVGKGEGGRAWEVWLDAVVDAVVA